MDTLSFLAHGFAVSLQPHNILLCFAGVLWGTVVGVLPGLGPLAGLTLLLPLTYHLEPVSAIIMLAGIFYGAMYGGSTTSILMRIPGEAASVITCIDGYEMARKGRAGPALVVAALGSWVGGTVSIAGYGLRKFEFDVAPLILAVVLGERIEASFRRALLISDGDYWALVQSSISRIFLGAIVLLITLQGLALILGYRRSSIASSE
jgi:putative tricarboxylic transport membrane protein